MMVDQAELCDTTSKFIWVKNLNSFPNWRTSERN